MAPNSHHACFWWKIRFLKILENNLLIIEAKLKPRQGIEVFANRIKVFLPQIKCFSTLRK
jgi:hypothetical protein